MFGEIRIATRAGIPLQLLALVGFESGRPNDERDAPPGADLRHLQRRVRGREVDHHLHTARQCIARGQRHAQRGQARQRPRILAQGTDAPDGPARRPGADRHSRRSAGSAASPIRPVAPTIPTPRVIVSLASARVVPPRDVPFVPKRPRPGSNHSIVLINNNRSVTPSNQSIVESKSRRTIPRTETRFLRGMCTRFVILCSVLSEKINRPFNVGRLENLRRIYRTPRVFTEIDTFGGPAQRFVKDRKRPRDGVQPLENTEGVNPPASSNRNKARLFE